MKIKKLSVRNIRSHQNFEITFPEGSLLLAGDVGSGKTSILLAIEYALFGLQPGQTGSSLLRNKSLSAEVILEIEIDGQEIIIERRLKRSSKSINNDYAAITLNGNKIECSITELKTKILRLLSYPDEFLKKNNILYRYTVYTQQENMKQIIIEDPESRLNILRHIFGIDKYKIIRENLDITSSKLKEDIKLFQFEVKDLDRDKLNFEVIKTRIIGLEDNVKNRITDLNNKIQLRKKLELDIKEVELKIKEKDKLENELEKALVLNASKKDQLGSAKLERDYLNKNIIEIGKPPTEEDLNLIIEKINYKKNRIDYLNTEYIKIISQKNSSEERKIDFLQKRDRIFKIDSCPTCLQDVPEVHKHNIINETDKNLSDITKNLAILDNNSKEIISSLSMEKEEQKSLERSKIDLEILRSKSLELEKAKNKLLEVIKLSDNLEKDLQLLQKHQQSLKESISLFLRFNSLFKIKQEELKESFISEKNIEINIAEIKKEIELLHKEIIILELSIKSKDEIKKKLLNVQDLSDWLSNYFLNLITFTEKQVMLKLRLEFSKLFSKWFHTIAGESFEVQLDENFTPLISQGDTEMDYSFLSGGERTAIALAYRLALNQTINSLISQIKTKDLIILDEPTDGFSDAQIEKIRDVLSELKVKQLIIVSHEQKIEGFVDHVIKLKKDNSSSIEQTEQLPQNLNTYNI